MYHPCHTAETFKLISTKTNTALHTLYNFFWVFFKNKNTFSLVNGIFNYKTNSHQGGM